MGDHLRYPKRLRLKDFSYTGRYRYFVTIRCFKSQLHFTDGNIVAKIIGLLKTTSEQERFSIWAYCFMPDHLHLLTEGKMDDSDMRRFVSMFKQKSGFWFQRDRCAKLWQENYYEHVLRTNEDVFKVSRYIFDNPVRKGLVQNYSEYHYLGSFEFPIADLT